MAMLFPRYVHDCFRDCGRGAGESRPAGGAWWESWLQERASPLLERGMVSGRCGGCAFECMGYRLQHGAFRSTVTGGTA